jgi:hypothetical protein
MGHTDDLEEFDAELEISLKREYSTVFPLFSYCVVTQEATYLCNRLSMDCVPHAGFLLFELRMEDVWVWDRNRPTRIIPRAQVYTTGDVTVEQLKDEGSEDFNSAITTDIMEQIRAANSLEEESLALEPGIDSDVGPSDVEDCMPRAADEIGSSEKLSSDVTDLKEDPS